MDLDLTRDKVQIKMFHTEVNQNWIINQNFFFFLGEGDGAQKTQFFQKVEIIFENPRFWELYDSIKM